MSDQPVVYPSQLPPSSPQVGASVPDDQRPGVGLWSQAMPGVVAQAPDPLNPPSPRPSAKETMPAGQFEPSADVGSGVQTVEELRSPEIPVEVEKYLQEVRANQDQIPAEVVITDPQSFTVTTPPMAKPVIVLPMTKQEYQAAKKSSVRTSKRWLGTWVEKLLKMFRGEVVFSDKQLP